MQLKKICIDQAKNLLIEFGEFYPFAFGESLNGEIVSINTYSDDEYPLSEVVLKELENALKVSDIKNKFKSVAICLDVLDTPPYLNERMDCLEIRIDEKTTNSFNFVIPYRKTEEGKITFLDEYISKGSLIHFDR